MNMRAPSISRVPWAPVEEPQVHEEGLGFSLAKCLAGLGPGFR